MNKLHDTVAVVAGGSRGAGKGISLVLGEQGATVYVAARTSRSGKPPSDGAPGTVEETAEEVTARGGRGIAVCADLSVEQDVATLFERVRREQGRVDVLANSAWGPNVMPEWSRKFWELSPRLWPETRDTMSIAWWTSVYAARLMTEAGGGLIVHVTDNAPGDEQAVRGQILFDVGHECLNRFIGAMARDSRKAKISIVGMNPGFMRTERVRMHMTSEARKKQFRYDLSETPEYIGRAVAALAADRRGALKRSGKLLWVCDMAKEYGFTDTDGRHIPQFDPKRPFQGYPWEEKVVNAAR